jgi:hypothetical protein
LTRERSTVLHERVTLIKRVQRRLEAANSTLAAVAAALRGGAGRALLAARVAGHPTPQTWAECAKGRLRSNRDL